jgi:vacuolar-type H+-ATPase subunit E/Vma4
MQGFEKIIESIKAESERECNEIALKAIEQCEKIHEDNKKREQDEYWHYVNTGSKEIEQRIKQLTDMAAEQAKKLAYTMQQELLDEVLEMTARKLSALPSRKYNELLKKLGVEAGCKPEYLVEHYRDDLTPSVTTALFD